jgi:hypothetical protein
MTPWTLKLISPARTMRVTGIPTRQEAVRIAMHVRLPRGWVRVHGRTVVVNVAEPVDREVAA